MAKKQVCDKDIPQYNLYDEAQYAPLFGFCLLIPYAPEGVWKRQNVYQGNVRNQCGRKQQYHYVCQEIAKADFAPADYAK